MKKKTFCKKGHDLSVVGLTKQGNCKQCHRDAVKHIRIEIKQGLRTTTSKKQFCIRGHDTWVCGRDIHNTCKECKKLMDRKYSNTEKGKITKRRGRTKYANSEHGKLVEKKYKSSKAGKAVHNKAVLKCQINRSLRLVGWTDWENIDEFERNKPKGMSSDHIIPLQNELVSGLHVSWNLQYLTKHQNSKKNNKTNLIKISRWYGEILKKEGLK